MSWSVLAAGLKDIYDADITDSDLHQTMRGFYLDSAPQNTKPPFITCRLVSDTPNDVFNSLSRSVFYDFDFEVYVSRDQAQSVLDGIVDQIRTHFNRAQPTLDSGYTASHIFFLGTERLGLEDDRRVAVMSWRCHVAWTEALPD